jgi:antitoxin component of MazEF toxin-antitoxin module
LFEVKPMSDTLVRPGKVAQWGNGAAVRISNGALERAKLHIDDPVDVIARDDEIVIRRARPRVSLDELLARFDPEKHRRDPVLDDEPVGTETHAQLHP